MSGDRRPDPADPTAERTAESSTQTASGLSGGRAGTDQARERDDGTAKVIPRRGEDERGTPRRAGEGDEDPVMPDDDPSLGTKI